MDLVVVVNAIIIIFGCATFTSCSSPALMPIVKTSNGLVRGSIAISRDGKIFHQFLGIPYATPPLGDLRFEVGADQNIN